MAKVRVRVALDPDAPEKIYHLKGVKGALDKQARSIAGRANALGAGYRTARFYDRNAKEQRGNAQPKYEPVDAMDTRKSSVALVHNANYAAYKDTLLHNTLLKAIGG